ncbi:MAG: diacylglycerol kinase family lipid kinase [Chloroflexi bacterium]|nr:diacylglycerol kinase family lipid kinase [Chloroflexota bacterium]
MPVLPTPYSRMLYVASDFYIIVNPAADRGRADRLVPRIEKAFDAEGVSFELARSARRGHAAELAEAAARAGRGAVIAVGGDGVVHEVANGLMRASGDDATTPLGVIPAGTGNDFVKMLGLAARRPEDAIRTILAARPRAVDIGKVCASEMEGGPDGAWYFTNGIGLGFDAQVAVHASRIRRLRGMAVYAVALLRTLRDLKSPNFRISVDGVEIANRALILATIANGPCHGGSFWLAPDARLDDGLFDVLVADARSVGEVIALIPSVMRGRHLSARGVKLLRGTSVEVRSDELLPIHADGEIIARGVRWLTIELLPGRLMVLA